MPKEYGVGNKLFNKLVTGTTGESERALVTGPQLERRLHSSGLSGLALVSLAVTKQETRDYA